MCIRDRCGDVGQGKDLDGLYEKALGTGASDAYIEDLTEEFITDYVYPTMQADAMYEGKYLLGTSFARPIIAKRLVEIAKEVGADAICHGATGKGNDQVRFELTVKALAPELDIIAPWRIWDIKSREEEIEYAQARNIPVPVEMCIRDSFIISLLQAIHKIDCSLFQRIHTISPFAGIAQFGFMPYILQSLGPLWNQTSL